MLLRVVHEGTISFYDESLVVNEISKQSLYYNEYSNTSQFFNNFSSYENPNVSYKYHGNSLVKVTRSVPNWGNFGLDVYEAIESSKNYYIKSSTGFTKIRNMKQFDELFKVSNDIKKVATKHRKLNKRQIFIMALYTVDPKIKEYLLRYFKDVTIISQSDSINVEALVPLTDWSIKGNNSILILDEGSIEIIDLNSLNRVAIGEEIFIPVMDKLSKKLLLAKLWNHNDQEFAVATYGKTQNIFNYDNKGKLLIYQKDNKGKWRLNSSSATLKRYIETIKN
jgi:hypothetical protein